MSGLARAWQEIEIRLTASQQLANPYLEHEVTVTFSHDSGLTIRRPAFWDGGQSWGVRFASPMDHGTWRWQAASSLADKEIDQASGELIMGPGPATGAHPALGHGFWRLSSTARCLTYADQTSALVVGDTPWAMPWRATLDQVETYAADRERKGFNAALLMTVQPDMLAVGPPERGVDHGFAVGFADLPSGHLNELNPDYFQYFDKIIEILINHQITPVYQPVFHGFGWKGLQVAGPVVPPEEYARYCRYLVARYGARPAIYLVGADGLGTEPQIAAGGQEIEAWDAYGQPTGIHYRPHARNNAHQAADWLDFQWCQTGHSGEHVPERLADMWRNEPPKAILNGEPTYEHSGRRGKGEGWWQGHEAWSNLCAGGTMGVIYGAGSLWQWLVRPDEPGHEPFFQAEGAGWREAIDFEGSNYVGLVGKILAGLPLEGLEPCWDVALNPRGLLAPGTLYLTYAEHGGSVRFLDAAGRVPLSYRVIDPRTGAVINSGTRANDQAPIEDPGGEPRVFICYDGER